MSNNSSTPPEFFQPIRSGPSDHDPVSQLNADLPMARIGHHGIPDDPDDGKGPACPRQESEIAVFSQSDILKRLNELHGNSGSAGQRSKQVPAPKPEDPAYMYDGDEDENEDVPTFGPDHQLSSDESQRSCKLLHLYWDNRKGRRDALIGNETSLERVRDLRVIAPQFTPVIDIVENAMVLSVKAHTPLTIPPLLLLGPPGIGKTFFARKLALALGTPFQMIPMNLTSAFWQLAGLDPSWKSAKPGKISTALIDGRSAQPVFLFDEVDKVVTTSSNDHPLDVMHSLWEPENARNFRDEYYDLGFDASHIISIATANSLDGLSPSLIDRLLVVNIPPPTRHERRAIAVQIYTIANAAAGEMFEPLPPDAVLDRLASLTPRRISRVVMLALPRAAAAGRISLTIDDIRVAEALIADGDSPKPKRIGFTALQN